ncbi:MAG: hypothetical protein ACMG6E_00170 [Candidatus Roizmanbacteria bacterium]
MAERDLMEGVTAEGDRLVTFEWRLIHRCDIMYHPDSKILRWLSDLHRVFPDAPRDIKAGDTWRYDYNAKIAELKEMDPTICSYVYVKEHSLYDVQLMFQLYIYGLDAKMLEDSMNVLESCKKLVPINFFYHFPSMTAYVFNLRRDVYQHKSSN